MAEISKTKVDKAPKLADPVGASIDIGTQEMIARAQKMGIDTVFDRAVQMKPCAIGLQGICCKNCAMGPCRLPLPKGGIEGEDTRKGPCGCLPLQCRLWAAAAGRDPWRNFCSKFPEYQYYRVSSSPPCQKPFQRPGPGHA